MAYPRPFLTFFWLFMVLAVVSVSSCKDDDESTDPVYEPISFKVPPGWPAPVYQFTNNEVTDQRFELGRRLFYDPILSRDNSVSCGTCHQQAGAFAHIDHKVSHGIDNLSGNRNSPPIYNLAWHSNFFWDGGVNHIEVQPINPIQNPVEMDESLANVVSKLQSNAGYRSMFKMAYGSDSVTSQNMLRAIAQFMAVMVSSNSRYDKYMRGEAGGTLDAEELSGLALVRLKCTPCHKEPLFTDLTFRNNGLDTVFTADPGRYLITLDPNDAGKFKVPSLRNVEVTYPFMHDGRVKNLDKVLDHYISGVQNSATLDPLLTGGIPLTPTEKAHIIKFLKTLTDYEFLANSRFSDPF